MGRSARGDSLVEMASFSGGEVIIVVDGLFPFSVVLLLSMLTGSADSEVGTDNGSFIFAEDCMLVSPSAIGGSSGNLAVDGD